MKRIATTAWLVVALLLALCGPPAFAQAFPPLSGRVVDAANVIADDREAALVAKLASLEQSTGRQLVIATLPNLQGYPLSDYGYRLGRAWKIGEKGKNSGVLLLLAPNERPGQRGPRIEVGYGREPILTDGLSSLIIREKMLPLLRSGDITGAVEQGSDAIITQLQLPPDQAAERARSLARQTQQAGSDGSSGAAVFWLFVFIFFILPMLWPLIFGRGRRGRRFGSGPPVIIWGPGDWGNGSSSSWGGGSFGSSGGFDSGFSGGGGSFGGGGASGDW